MSSPARAFPHGPAGADRRLAPLALAAASAALLGGALLFQHAGGLQPCVLCVYQRWPHGVVVALGLLGALLAPRLGAGGLAAVCFAVAGASLAGAGIAGFHAGVEQGRWAGLEECGGTVGSDLSLAELKAQLLAQPVVRCDEVPWSLFGISLAGYNLLASLALAAAAAWAGMRFMRSGR